MDTTPEVYTLLETIFNDCYGHLKRPLGRRSKVSRIITDYVLDPKSNRRAEGHVVGSLNEVFFGTLLDILLTTDALLTDNTAPVSLQPSNLHEDSCGVDYFLRVLPTNELIGGLDVKCSPTARIKTPNNLCAMHDLNRLTLGGPFMIVEVGSDPHALGIFDYMQLLRDFMLEGFDPSIVTPENFIRGELSNGRQICALGGVKETLGHYIEDRNLSQSFRYGLGCLYDTVDWHIANTGNIDYGGLY